MIKRIKRLAQSIVLLLAVSVMTSPVYAADGDAAWAQVTQFLTTWIPRLGGAVIVIGLIMFGLGWQSDDAAGKTRGIQVIVGGAIIAAVGSVAGTFMA